jgi:hypothetical protein
MRQINASRECVADGFCRPTHRSSKPTGRWCMGHVGVSHLYMWERKSCGYANVVASRWLHEERICFMCGRKEHRYRVTCKACGAHRRMVYGFVTWCFRGRWIRGLSSQYACDCADNNWPGWSVGRDEAVDVALTERDR